MSEALKLLLSIVPDIAERIVDAVAGKKQKTVRLTDILSDLEVLQLRRDAAMRKARNSVAKKKRGP